MSAPAAGGGNERTRSHGAAVNTRTKKEPQ